MSKALDEVSENNNELKDGTKNTYKKYMQLYDDIKEVQKGFMIKERLLRPSLVGVSKKKDQKDEENKENKENLDK